MRFAQGRRAFRELIIDHVLHLGLAKRQAFHKKAKLHPKRAKRWLCIISISSGADGNPQGASRDFKFAGRQRPSTNVGLPKTVSREEYHPRLATLLV